ncbi:hypothetical protein LCGC14_1220140 [marine sediment metagenome]|uniref:Uncharacterized protein n=1 Tax=marine sediment metagenome TaxID=412755 RepID=A0A0F9LYX4_9ZZZZ
MAETKIIGSRALDRRDYFIGCALQGLVQTHDHTAASLASGVIVNKAIAIGSAIADLLHEEALQAAMADAAATKEAQARDAAGNGA